MSAYTPNYNFELIDFGIRPWDEKMNANFLLLDKIISVLGQIPNLTGVWQNSRAYTVGQVAFDGTQLTFWRCVTAHTSDATSTFTFDRTARPANWSYIAQTAGAVLYDTPMALQPTDQQRVATSLAMYLASQVDALLATAATNTTNAINTSSTNIIGGAASGRNTLKKVSDALDVQQARVDGILGGADAAVDTFLEVLQRFMADEANITALLTAVGNRVRFDAAQTLTNAQQTQALANIGAPAAANGTHTGTTTLATVAATALTVGGSRAKVDSDGTPKRFAATFGNQADLPTGATIYDVTTIGQSLFSATSKQGIFGVSANFIGSGAAGTQVVSMIVDIFDTVSNTVVASSNPSATEINRTAPNYVGLTNMCIVENLVINRNYYMRLRACKQSSAFTIGISDMFISGLCTN